MNIKHLKNLFGLSFIVFSLVDFSGGFFNILVQPGPYVQAYGRIYAIDPRMDMQTNVESPRAFLCNSTTVIGVFLIAYSGRRLDKPVLSYRLLLLGIALTGFGLMGSYYMLEMKRSAVPVG